MADLGWEDDDATWGGVDLTSKDFVPVYADADEFFILGYDGSQALDSYLERRAVLYEPGRILLGTYVWPQIIGPAGFDIQIKLGKHDTPEGAIEWEGPYNFTIDEDECVDFEVSGRYLAIHFSSSGVPAWKLQSFSIDYERIGGF